MSVLFLMEFTHFSSASVPLAVPNEDEDHQRATATAAKQIEKCSSPQPLLALAIAQSPRIFACCCLRRKIKKENTRTAERGAPREHTPRK